MILIHLSVNGKSAICDMDNILFAEEIDSEDDDGKAVHFTRIYLKQPLPGDNGSVFIDVQESVEKMVKYMKQW